jgi:hypothetical protein
VNLIEQLGGYERAKSVVNNCPKNGMFYRDMDSVCDPLGILYYAWFGCSLLVLDEDKGWIKSIYHDGNEYIADQLESLDELRKEILQYRREHGIFEVGDKVVLIKGKRALLVMFIVEVNTETLCIKNRDGATIIFNKLHIRHATDEEIKAGHRL